MTLPNLTQPESEDMDGLTYVYEKSYQRNYPVQRCTDFKHCYICACAIVSVPLSAFECVHVCVHVQVFMQACLCLCLCVFVSARTIA